MAEPPEGEEPAPAAGKASGAYSNYVLGLLFVVYVFNFVDRQILAILLEPIRRDLGASDSQMGFLTGFAFAVFYTTAGIPIARFADRSVRRSVIAAGLALWSGMTAVSGLARSFTQLATARVLVGVGEAACSPPAHSLLADYFSPRWRATALSIYAMGIHVGILVGLVVGGWLNDHYGWRVAFYVVGLPGLLLALLVRFTVREPRRGASEESLQDEEVPTAREVFGFLWQLRSFRHLSIASALAAFAGYGMANWGPAFLMRVHGISSTEVGLKLGLLLGTAGAAGSLMSGFLVDALSRRDARWALRVPALAAAGGLPFALLFLFWPEVDTALAFAFPAFLVGAMWQGPIFSVTQSLARLRMRSVASAILLFIINLIGLGLGPWAVGILNDTVFRAHGPEAVRWSLASVTLLMNLWALVHFALGARTLREDLRAKERRA